MLSFNVAWIYHSMADGFKEHPRGIFLEAWMQGVKTCYDLRNVMVLCVTYLIGQART